MSSCASLKASIPKTWPSTARKSCETCLRPSSRIVRALNLIEREYLRSEEPWVVGFSGGKDSSALVKLLYQAISRAPVKQRRVSVVYCDTGVEIPVMNEAVRRTLRAVSKQAKLDNLPIKVEIAKPKLADRYFVKVIGRGYPPPTNKFRWCTDRLRINPIRNLMKSSIGLNATILLGTRWRESTERARTMQRHRIADDKYYFRQSQTGTKIFAPIVDFTLNDIWRTIFDLREPSGINAQELAGLYKDAGAECPVFREEKGTPCGSGRFGCWTCTVVRKDKAVKSLIAEGYTNLKPLFNFRNWLAEVRDIPELRCPKRRNGMPGPGPFTLAARKRILRRLLSAQSRSNVQLVDELELKEIYRLWRVDRRSPKYSET